MRLVHSSDSSFLVLKQNLLDVPVIFTLDIGFFSRNRALFIQNIVSYETLIEDTNYTSTSKKIGYKPKANSSIVLEESDSSERIFAYTYYSYNSNTLEITETQSTIMSFLQREPVLQNISLDEILLMKLLSNLIPREFQIKKKLEERLKLSF